MTQLHSYELTGKKESVANFISNISPTETPFTSMTSKASIANTMFQWLTDVDETPAAAASGIVEGADAVFKALVEPKMLHSYTQIFTRTAKVSKTAEAIGLYGRGKPMAYQMLKAGRAIKREIEMTMLSKQDGSVGTSAAGGKLDGFLTRKATQGAIPSENIVKSATAKTFSEDDLQKVLLELWKKGAEPSIVMYPPDYASAVSSLREHGGAVTNMFDGEKTVGVNRQVDVYVDPLGQRVKLIPNRYMPADTMYVFDPKMFEQKILRNFNTVDLPANGDYIAKQLVVELGLANKNPDAAGVYNLAADAIAAPSNVEGEVATRKAK